MSQRLGEWWRASQERNDPRTLPAWRRELYGALQAAVRPVQARSTYWQAQTPQVNPEAYRAALKAVYARCRRG